MLDAAAVGTLLGWSVRDVLDLPDRVEQQVVSEVLERAELLRVRRQDLFFQRLQATINNAIVSAFKGGG